MIFEAIIVDDEAPARVELINQLEETGRVKVVAEAVCLQEGIAKMKKGVRIINISRGAVVDTEALCDALESGKVAYAAMDVTDPEPLPGEHRLLSLPNVTVTPHMASATTETRDAMALLTVDNILAGLADEPLPAEVKVK